MSFHDTESRLRDYLADKARAVPDDASPPGLVSDPTRRRTWPALAAAAAIAAILILTVPVLVRLSDNEPPAAGNAGPVPISVPYILEKDRALYDGDAKVPLPADSYRYSVIGRAVNGWLVRKAKAGPPTQGSQEWVGLLTRSGQFLPRGSANLVDAALSPDRELAVVNEMTQAPKPDTRFVVVELKSGKRLHTLSPPYYAELIGWNKHGIWYVERRDGYQEGAFVWQPGQPRGRHIPVADFEWGHDAVRSTDRMIVTTSPGNEFCAKVVTGGGTETFETLRETCDLDSRENPITNHVALSPDGRFLVLLGPKVAIEIDSGRTTRLNNMPFALGWSSNVVFEDANNLLVQETPIVRPELLTGTPALEAWREAIGDRTDSTPANLYRCNTDSGSCESIYRGEGWLSLGQP